MADKSITATAVLPSSNGTTRKMALPAGVTVTQGQYLYLTAAGIIGGLADSNSGSAGDAVRGTFGVVCALSAGSPLQEIAVLDRDTVGFAPGFSPASGSPLFLSNTAGAITDVIGDLASGSTVVCLGGGLTGGLTMAFDPKVWGTK